MPVRGWTVEHPIAWPSGLTLVLGAGCYQCGGQYSTFYLVTQSGRLQLPKAAGEEHTSVLSDAPGHLYLARCVNDCDAYGRNPEAPETILEESSDGGHTWRRLARLNTLSYFVGRLSDGELVLADFGRPGPTAYVRFPSATPVVSPGGPDAFPVVLDGQIFWLLGSELLDAQGVLTLDLSSVLPAGARPAPPALGPQGALAVPWSLDGRSGLTILRGARAESFDGDLRTLQDYVWLDDDHLLGSFQYPPEVLAQLGADPLQSGSRIPTLLDVRSGTLEPFEDFLRVDSTFATFGRNLIEAAWP